MRGCMRGCVTRSSPQSAPRRVDRGERLSVGRSQRDTSRFGAESWDRLCPSDHSDRHAPPRSEAVEPAATMDPT